MTDEVATAEPEEVVAAIEEATAEPAPPPPMTVVVWALADEPYGVNVSPRFGAMHALFPAVSVVCREIAMQRLRGLGNRDPGPACMVDDIGLRAEDFSLVFLFDSDGMFVVDDVYCRPLTPAQLLYAAKTSDTRIGFLLQKEWVQVEQASVRDRIAVPGRRPN